jgi:hypothetical protein
MPCIQDVLGVPILDVHLFREGLVKIIYVLAGQ